MKTREQEKALAKLMLAGRLVSDFEGIDNTVMAYVQTRSRREFLIYDEAGKLVERIPDRDFNRELRRNNRRGRI